ncbi:MAG TPA: hypothetical protein VF351_09050, partial [Actinomycetota bacterium]
MFEHPREVLLREWVILLERAPASELTERGHERSDVERRVGHAGVVEIQEADTLRMNQELA